MPSIFKRLFRRKASSDNGKKKKLSRKERKALKKAQKNGSFMKPIPTDAQDVKVTPSPINNDEVIRKPSFGTSTSSTMSGHISPVGRMQPQTMDSSDYGHHHMQGVGSPTHETYSNQNEFYHSESQPVYNEDIERFHQPQMNNRFPGDTNLPPSMNFSQGQHGNGHHPFTDFANFPEENNENIAINGIQSSQQTWQGVPQPKSLQLTRLSDGQLVAMDRFGDNLQSPMSASSEFDLSTDAEDNEYNQIRRAAANNLSPMLEPTGSDNNSDDDVGLNPVMNRDAMHHGKNNHYLSESESEGIGPESTPMNRSKHYFSDSDNEGGLSQQSPVGSNGQLRSISNSTSTDKEDTGIKVDKSRFTFDSSYGQQPSPQNEQHPIPNESSSHSSSVDKSFNTGMSPRTMAIHQTKTLMAQGKLPADLYADSTDSEYEPPEKKEYNYPKDLLPPRSVRNGEDDSAMSSKSGRPTTPKEYQRAGKSSGIIDNFADFEKMNPNPSQHQFNSKSVAESSPVSELITQAKARRQSQMDAGNGNGSVNSAPLINAAALRNYHNIHQSKNRNDRSSSSASAAAKEKLRRRRKEKEAFLQSFSNDTDDESDKGNQRSSQWVFEDNNGVMGAQGIAADLESLGNQSRNSRISNGNRSYRSHRSHRSSKSTSRRKKRSDESVGSRHSRNSKYSIRSRSSEVSEMSQQSRSVANDLLRLEMQLAMVGSKSSSGEGGSGIRKQKKLESKSDSHRHSSARTVSMTKRIKTNIVAPAGKLGIILANKTDAKGTVVSGVRTTSVLANDITPGDRIIAIDGEDVSRMTVTEITAIMARKNDFERLLTVLTTPKRQESAT